MKPRAILKIVVDIAMTVALMLLMSYGISLEHDDGYGKETYR